jgi:hypothetical protein
MKALCLIVWMLLTVVLVCTVLGITLLISHITHYDRGAPDIKRSAWMEIGLKLLDSVLKQN